MPALLRTLPADQQQTPRRTPSDVTLVSTLAVLGATAVGWRWAGRPRPVRTITMGPGGWVSFKGAVPQGRRPWWARLLRAQRLVPDRAGRLRPARRG